MAWTETFCCDICGKEKHEESEDWWLAWDEEISPTPEVHQPMLKVTHWNSFLAHDSTAKHLCGGRCAHTLLDRWLHTAYEAS